jgi:hypothetical protein
MNDRWFAHSGDLGDIIYSLVAIREAGGGTLHLFDIPGRTWHGMNKHRANLITPLLEIQPYINRVLFWPDGHQDSTLNGFRDHWRPGRNLADMHLATLGFGPEARFQRWLNVDAVVEDYPIVFARSERCRNDAFPWSDVYANYRDRAIFVGLKEEYTRFCQEVGDLPFVATRDLLELARIIAGTRLFVGNQSAPAAIAEGLKKTMILEVDPRYDNCRFHRIARMDVVRGPIELPSLDMLGVTQD